jgi:regulator of protease activity HflC (stomatin/prohibitin superfamily)
MMQMVKLLSGLVLLVVGVLLLSFFGWFIESNNCATPGGYVGYVTQGAVLGRHQFLGTQVGPTSSGRIWLAEVTNVSVTPYTYDELFTAADGTSVLSKDGMQISFGVHITFRINPDRVKDFVEHYSTMHGNDAPDKIVEVAYKNFLKERVRTYARDAVQKCAWQDLTSNIDTIGQEVSTRVAALTSPTPFDVQSVVVGNIQFPPSVALAVAENQAQIQVTLRKQKEVEQAKLEAQKKVEEAKGIEEANKLIAGSLTDRYLQYEAIVAQGQQINSPNHTVIYIPVGPMGVPIVSTTNGADAATRPTSATDVKP